MLTGFGVYHGRFNFRSSGSGEKVITGEHMIPYPSSGPGGPSEIPVAISLTEFHLLLLYPSKILALSTLNNEIVFEQGFKERFGEMRGMVTDGYAPGSVYPLIWLFSNRYDHLCLWCTRASGIILPQPSFVQWRIPAESTGGRPRCLEDLPANCEAQRWKVVRDRSLLLQGSIARLMSFRS